MTSIDPETLTLLGQVLLGLWLMAIAASVGSFLNVVIYRVPAGLSVVHPGSRCPVCLHAIRGWDNVPIFSWFLLGGRCRDCGTPISRRYPLVETMVAVALMILSIEPFSGGANVPWPIAPPELDWRGPFTIWAIYALHAALLAGLIASTMIRYDGFNPAPRIFGAVAVAALIGPLLLPWLRPWPAGWTPWLGTTLEGLLGAFTAMALATLGWICERRGVALRDELSGRAAMASAVGLTLGWRPALLIVAGASLTALLVRLTAAGRPRLVRAGWALGATVLTLITILTWKWNPFGSQPTWMVLPLFCAAAVLVAVSGWVLGRFGPLAVESAPDHSLGAAPDRAEIAMPLEKNLNAIVNSSSYRLAELDTEFLRRPELRPVRVQLELLKPEMGFVEQDIHSTIVAFGGTQIVERTVAEQRLAEARRLAEAAPDDAALARRVARAERILEKSRYYDDAREFGRLVSSVCQTDGVCDYVIITGGGPGIMEAANRGAYDAGAKSIGLNITLPSEQAPNSYITPELCFQFHYFALRKMHFLMRAKALVIFPGGFGTLDELFDALTLRQTRRMQEIPIIIYGREYWSRVIDFQYLADEGVIADDHLDLISYAETPHEAWEQIARFHGHTTEGHEVHDV